MGWEEPFYVSDGDGFLGFPCGVVLEYDSVFVIGSLDLLEYVAIRLRDGKESEGWRWGSRREGLGGPCDSLARSLSILAEDWGVS